jgi:hypothetical protein
MKRTKNLYSRLSESENLRKAFYKAARGRRGQAEVEAFRQDLTANRNSNLGFRLAFSPVHQAGLPDGQRLESRPGLFQAGRKEVVRFGLVA